MNEISYRLRWLEEAIARALPDAQAVQRRLPTGGYEIRISFSDRYAVDPPPVGLIERDRERLVQEQE